MFLLYSAVILGHWSRLTSLRKMRKWSCAVLNLDVFSRPEVGAGAVAIGPEYCGGALETGEACSVGFRAKKTGTSTAILFVGRAKDETLERTLSLSSS
jgi:hypothetical protein